MNRNLRTTWILLLTASIFSFALTGFTLLNFETGGKTAGIIVNASATSVKPEAIPEGIAANGAIIFNNNCKSCHRLDEDLIGPALRHVYSRREVDWLKSWITNSSRMIAKGDPVAKEIFEKYGRREMTSFSTLTPGDLDALLAYMKFVDAQ